MSSKGKVGRSTIRKSSLTCSICNLTFGKKTSLISHHRLHFSHLSTCEICGMQFKTVEELNEHIITHVSIGKHFCSSCNISFSSETEFENHVKLHYDVDEENNQSLAKNDEEMNEKLLKLNKFNSTERSTKNKFGRLNALSSLLEMGNHTEAFKEMAVYSHIPVEESFSNIDLQSRNTKDKINDKINTENNIVVIENNSLNAFTDHPQFFDSQKNPSYSFGASDTLEPNFHQILQQESCGSNNENDENIIVLPTDFDEQIEVVCDETYDSFNVSLDNCISKRESTSNNMFTHQNTYSLMSTDDISNVETQQINTNEAVISNTFVEKLPNEIFTDSKDHYFVEEIVYDKNISDFSTNDYVQNSVNVSSKSFLPNLKYKEMKPKFITKPRKLQVFNKESKESNKKKYICEICNKDLETSSKFHVHMRYHTGERPYKCGVCNASFKQLSHLKSHALRHTKEKPHNCRFCGKGFIQISSMKTHEKYIHINPRKKKNTKLPPPKQSNFYCKLCDKTFIELCFRREHMKKYHGGKKFTCDVCVEKFTYSYQLAKHKIRSHKKDNSQVNNLDNAQLKNGSSNMNMEPTSYKVKNNLNRKHNFICSYCGKTFKIKSLLEVHVRMHTGYKPYKCMECSESFTQLNHLKSHYKRHVGSFLYMCDICHKLFKSSILTESHIKTSHDKVGKGISIFSSIAYKEQIGLAPATDKTLDKSKEVVISISEHSKVEDKPLVHVKSVDSKEDIVSCMRKALTKTLKCHLCYKKLNVKQLQRPVGGKKHYYCKKCLHLNVQNKLYNADLDLQLASDNNLKNLESSSSADFEDSFNFEIEVVNKNIFIIDSLNESDNDSNEIKCDILNTKYKEIKKEESNFKMYPTKKKNKSFVEDTTLSKKNFVIEKPVFHVNEQRKKIDESVKSSRTENLKPSKSRNLAKNKNLSEKEVYKNLKLSKSSNLANKEYLSKEEVYKKLVSNKLNVQSNAIECGKFNCLSCKSNFKTEKGFKIHSKKCSTLFFECSSCKEIISDTYFLNIHRCTEGKTNHFMEVKSFTKTVTCDLKKVKYLIDSNLEKIEPIIIVD